MIVNATQVLNNNQNTQFISSTGQILQGHIIPGAESTVQMITTPSGATQLLHIQRATNDRCEIIVQPEVGK